MIYEYGLFSNDITTDVSVRNYFLLLLTEAQYERASCGKNKETRQILLFDGSDDDILSNVRILTIDNQITIDVLMYVNNKCSNVHTLNVYSTNNNLNMFMTTISKLGMWHNTVRTLSLPKIADKDKHDIGQLYTIYRNFKKLENLELRGYVHSSYFYFTWNTLKTLKVYNLDGTRIDEFDIAMNNCFQYCEELYIYNINYTSEECISVFERYDCNAKKLNIGVKYIKEWNLFFSRHIYLTDITMSFIKYDEERDNILDGLRNSNIMKINFGRIMKDEYDDDGYYISLEEKKELYYATYLNIKRYNNWKNRNLYIKCRKIARKNKNLKM